MEVWIGLAGVGVLAVYFRAVQTRWPLSYFAVADLTGYKVSASPGRYLVFRFLPVLLVSFFTGTLVVRGGGNLVLALGVMVAGHVVLSSGRGLFSLVRDPTSFARRVQALLHLVVALLVAIAALGGGLLAFVPALQGLVPDPTEVSSALWTAALAAVGGAALIRVTQARTVDEGELIGEAKRNLGPRLWNKALDVAVEVQADPALAWAILVVESLQRPRWFRRLERLKGKILPAGSYGVMQVRAERPVSDEESIRIAITSRLAGTARIAEASDDYPPLREILHRYNPSPTFIELAERVYFRLLSELPPRELEAESDWEDDAGEPLMSAKRLVALGTVGGVAAGLVLLGGLAILRSVVPGGKLVSR